MMIARSAFGPGQARQLVPALQNGFTTDLSDSELYERLRLLWQMRDDIAIHVRDIIILGQARCEPPGAVLLELLELAQQFATYTD